MESNDKISDDDVLMKNMCNDEKLFVGLKNFIDNHDDEQLEIDMKKMFENMIEYSDDDDTIKRQEMLLMCRVFRKIKTIDKQAKNYRNLANKYRQCDKMYIKNDKIVDKVVKYNDMKDDNDTDKMINLLSKCMTPIKMKHELLLYELLHYKTNEKIEINKNSIVKIINRFDLLISSYLENRSWTVNLKNTKNFIVPKNAVVFSNTVNRQDVCNSNVKNHMNMLVQYLKRCYNISRVKVSIKKDTKYKLGWILVYVYFE